MILPPHTAHAATAGTQGVRCLEAPRSKTKSPVDGSGTWRACPMIVVVRTSLIAACADIRRESADV